MAWDRDLADIVGRLRDIEREIEAAIAEAQDELNDTEKIAHDEGYNIGYSDKEKEG